MVLRKIRKITLRRALRREKTMSRSNRLRTLAWLFAAGSFMHLSNVAEALPIDFIAETSASADTGGGCFGCTTGGNRIFADSQFQSSPTGGPVSASAAGGS